MTLFLVIIGAVLTIVFFTVLIFWLTPIVRNAVEIWRWRK